MDAWRGHLPFEQVSGASNEIEKTKDDSVKGQASAEVLEWVASGQSLCKTAWGAWPQALFVQIGFACSEAIAERLGDARSEHLPSGQVNGAWNEIEKIEDTQDSTDGEASAQVRAGGWGLSRYLGCCSISCMSKVFSNLGPILQAAPLDVGSRTLCKVLASLDQFISCCKVLRICRLP